MKKEGTERTNNYRKQRRKKIWKQKVLRTQIRKYKHSYNIIICLNVNKQTRKTTTFLRHEKCWSNLRVKNQKNKNRSTSLKAKCPTISNKFKATITMAWWILGENDNTVLGTWKIWVIYDILKFLTIKQSSLFVEVSSSRLLF